MREPSRQMSLAILLWAWFTVPFPQILALRALGQNSHVVALSPESERSLKMYYSEIALSAVLLSVIGPALIWRISSQSSNLEVRLFYGAAIGFVLSALAVIIIPIAREAGEGQGQGQAVNSAYFVCATVFSGAICAYLKAASSARANISMVPMLRFIGEGIAVWLAVLRIPVGVWLSAQPVVASDLNQLAVGIPALFWAAVCSLLFWSIRPRTPTTAVAWAIAVALLVSKTAGYLIYFLGMIGFPGALASGVIARLEIGRTGNGFVHDYVIGTLIIFGPSVLWGIIMGYRRLSYAAASID